MVGGNLAVLQDTIGEDIRDGKHRENRETRRLAAVAARAVSPPDSLSMSLLLLGSVPARGD